MTSKKYNLISHKSLKKAERMEKRVEKYGIINRPPDTKTEFPNDLPPCRISKTKSRAVQAKIRRMSRNGTYLKRAKKKSYE